ncbi:S1/P1 nuclease [Brumimicrobium aurantiacum]|uniref:S1/P1 Nuclease n=1 Tax=Brumimicrobium aurantiacum TaxID=1737063 RepID=A0A3E1EUS2_9FLAO|nr:S1/P1 nuclease [Brumimicrobium aurantiacum]RFC53314.1 S1/P1 Nuclease [Brumimicrobium aurantiacum]
MKRIITYILFVFTLIVSLEANAWGLLGHRVVGEVAIHHLNESAKHKIKSILGNQTLAEVSTWMDDIKSDSKYDSLKPWHYVTIPDGMRYSETNKNPQGDVIAGINFVVDQLKSDTIDPTREKEYLMMLVHLVGDIHQPLHVGNGTDRGGNQVEVRWFGEKSNLHRVWDTQMLDGKKYSYTELTKIINHPEHEEIVSWQTDNVEDWAHQCMEFRDGIYTMADGYSWAYKYQYVHWDTMKKQLLKGGVRLAGLLNDIYG